MFSEPFRFGGPDITRGLLAANSNSASSLERSFEQKMMGTEGVTRLDLRNLSALKKAFAQAASADPYYISPVYYSLTGRRGLWKFQKDESGAVLFCLHPNMKDTVLVFPPFGPKGLETLDRLIRGVFRHIDLTVEIGRVPHKDTTIFETAKAAYTTALWIPRIMGRKYSVSQSANTVLDWVFPVHTIDCNALVKREGPSYQPLRQAINHVKRNHKNRQTRNIDFTNRRDLDLINSLADAWERETTDKHQHRAKYDADIDSDYFKYLAGMGRHPDLNVHGLFLYVEGQPVGFSIWEIQEGKEITANLFASQIGNLSINHLSAYLIYKTGKTLAEQGIGHICLGGSEHKEMDRFKRKFVPSGSTQLKSILIRSPANSNLAAAQNASPRPGNEPA